MGRGIPALLGLCCLLAGALCPGVAQDLFPSGSAGGLSEAPPDLSVLPTSGEGVMSDPEEQTWPAGLTEVQSVTLSPATGETGVTERSVLGADDVDPGSASAHHGIAMVVGTDSMDEAVSGSAETTTALSRTFSEQDDTGREGTNPDNSVFTPTANPTTLTPTAPAREEQTAEATDIPSASTPATSFEPPAGQSQSEVAQLSVTTRSPELHTKWTATITTNAFLRSTASPTILATQSTAPNKTSPSEVQEQPSVLDVGEKDLPKFYSRGNSNSLFVMIISIFTIMVVLVIVVVVFHRYRQKNNRTEFRRLQDLPMIGWYNAVLDPPFHLPYPEDALAFVVLSVPSMFERTFIPFLREHKLQELRDPIDQCVAHQISLAQQSFPSDRIDVIYDYELHPNRRPKALMQTAAHVSGATYYYQRSDVLQDPWGDKKMFGVCIHPRFGGWFAIRAVLVFSDVRAPSLEQLLPIDCIPSREDRIQLLEDFNLRWRDGKYRDVLPPEERYSAEQILYFATPPAERFKLLEEWGVLHQPPLG